MMVEARTPRLGVSVLALSLGALSLGCQTPPLCAERGNCGGELMGSESTDFVVLNALHEPPPGMQDAVLDGSPGQDSVVEREWSLTGGCMDEVKSAPTPLSQVRQPAKAAGERSVERTLPDWCSSIVLAADGTVKEYDGFYTMLLQNEGWFPAVPVSAGSLTFSANNRYQVKLTQRLAQRAELSASCLSAQGASLTCAAFAPSLQSYITEQLQSFVKDPNYRTFTAGVTNVACADAAQGGCVCDYDLVLSGGPSGRYSRAGSQLTFFDDQYRPPSLADYCVNGPTLEVSSQEQTRLFNKADLRNVVFAKPSCQDGVRSLSLGETGVDCGGSCAPCPP
jgi:hypothetical protein